MLNDFVLLWRYLEGRVYRDAGSVDAVLHAKSGAALLAGLQNHLDALPIACGRGGAQGAEEIEVKAGAFPIGGNIAASMYRNLTNMSISSWNTTKFMLSVFRK